MSEVSFALSAKLKSTQQMINLRIIFLGLADLWIPCPAKKGWIIVSRFWEVASFSLTFLCSSALLFELWRQTVLERKVLWTTSSLSFRKMGCMGCLSKQLIGFTLRQGTLVLEGITHELRPPCPLTPATVRGLPEPVVRSIVCAWCQWCTCGCGSDTE